MTKKKAKKRNWRKLLGLLLVVEAILILTPPYFILPTELEFYFLFLIPFWGMGVLVVPFLIAAGMLVVGLYLLNLPLNGDGVKKALKRAKPKRRRK